VDGIGNYTCKCPQLTVDLTAYGGPKYIVGFNGSNCENSINECDYSPKICMSGAMCAEAKSPIYYQCFCGIAIDGYQMTGKLQKIKI
jgi:hypothetical protein